MDLSSAIRNSDRVSSYEFEDIRNRVNSRLAELLPADEGRDEPLSLAMREAILPAGKRVRSILLVLTARGLGRDSTALYELGSAVEMVHTASLILDDLPCMDNANLRRGRPTIHRRFGEDVAVLTAVAMLTRAFGLVSAAPGVSPLVRMQMVSQLASAVGVQGLVKGQYEDLYEGNRRRSATEIMSTNRLKTGMLFEVPVAMAALVAAANEFVAKALSCFALELGQAFQLLDDLTDDSASNGKDVGQDQGKATLVALLGKDEVLRRLADHLDQADHFLAEVYAPDQAVSRFMRGLFAQFDERLATPTYKSSSELAPARRGEA